MLNKSAAKHAPLVSESSWYNYLHNVFEQEPVGQPAAQTEQHRRVRRWTGTELAMESLVKLPMWLGCRHNNAQPLGPHPFNLKACWTCQKTIMMSCALWSPPAFLDFTQHPLLGSTQFLQTSFTVLASACPNKWEKAPHIAALFNLKLLIGKANVMMIPRPWKEAKLTPNHKRGPVAAQPGNYRIIMIDMLSHIRYRLCANLLCSMI